MAVFRVIGHRGDQLVRWRHFCFGKVLAHQRDHRGSARSIDPRVLHEIALDLREDQRTPAWRVQPSARMSQPKEDVTQVVWVENTGIEQHRRVDHGREGYPPRRRSRQRGLSALGQTAQLVHSGFKLGIARGAVLEHFLQRQPMMRADLRRMQLALAHQLHEVGPRYVD